MGVYALTSISGSPGVTTTAVAWATISARPTILIEADLTGGSPILAGRYRSTTPHTTSLLALTMRPPHTTLTEQLWTQAIPLPDATDAWLVPAITDPAQAHALTHLGQPLAEVLAQLSDEAGFDIVIDAGRYRPANPLTPLLAHAHTIIMLTWSHLPGLHRTITALDRFRDDVNDPTGHRTAIGLLDPPTQGFNVAAAAKVTTPSPVLTQIPHLPAAAAAYSLGTPPPPRRRLRRYQHHVTALAEQAERHATQIHASTWGSTT